MSSKRKYALVDLVDDIGLLDLSEEELIDDDDTDRESNFHLSDIDSSQDETGSEMDYMLIDEPSTSGVCNVANSPSPVEENPLESDDDEAVKRDKNKRFSAQREKAAAVNVLNCFCRNRKQITFG